MAMSTPQLWQNMCDGIEHMRCSPRGTSALHALRRFIEDHAIGLDSRNWKAVADILAAAHEAPTSTVDAINAVYE